MVLMVSAVYAQTVSENQPLGTKMFRANLQRTGVYDGRGFTGNNKTLWRFRTGAAVHSSPALQDNLLYFGSNDGYVYCLNSDSGTLKWKFKASDGVSSSPALANGLVYFQANDNHFYALDAKNGKKKWDFAGLPNVPFDGHCPVCPSEAGGWDYWVSSPAVDGSKVYFGSGDGHIYSLNSLNGKLNWKFKTGGRVRSSPAVFQNTIYAGSLDGKMYAVDATKGTLLWSFKAEGNEYFPTGEIQSTPAIAAGMVIFGSRDYYLYALAAGTGELKWKNWHKDSWVIASPAIIDNGVYIGTSDGKTLQRVDLMTGKEVWQTNVNGNVFASPAVGADLVYVGTAGGDIFVLSRDKGQIGSGRIYDSRIISTPIIAKSVVYFGAENGYMYAVK